MMYSTPLGTAKPLINFPTIFPNQKPRKDFYFSLKPTKRLQFSSRPRVFLPKASSNSKPSVNSDVENEDFMTRVMRENPSQVEPRYLIGDKLYTLKEKEILNRRGFSERISELLKRLNLKPVGRTDKEIGNESDFVKREGEIYLKDLLREYKGKLYVPDKVFGPKLSEEEEFDKNLKELPKMSYEDFQEYLDYDKIKLVTFKEYSGVSLYRDFVVDLKEIPGEKSLHTTKWVIRLNGEQVQDLLAIYKGPLNEIENRTMSSLGKVPEFPPPAASKLSSRMMVELGAITAAMASTAFVIVAVSATAFLSVFEYSFTTLGDVIVPAIWRVVTFFLGIVFGILKTIAENVVELLLDGGLVSQVFEVVNIGKLFSGVGVLKPVIAILLLMVFVIRFTLSRKPKNFKRWDIWQGIEFSKSKAQARVDGSTGVKFSDVAGIDDAVEELQELVRYLKNPELFDQMGIKAPHGVLLDGPPGCGKTLVAKAIAGEAGVPFYQMAGSEFVEVLVGVGAARIRDLFKRAKVNKPAVIFIDEIDALATRRQSKIANKTTDEHTESATQERETTLNQLLIELDGFDTGKGVIFLGATNRRDLLDPALLRPGRFDRKIKIRAPNAKGRLEILKVHARKVKLSDTVDLATYANNLPGWTGAKLAQLLQEAALMAVRKGHTAILPSDMDNAVDRLTVGPKHIGVRLSHEGQCHRAATEGGTALVSQLLRRFENAKVEQCARVSIHPHGKTLSQLVFNRLEDEAYKYERKPQLLHRLQVFLAARAAEEVIFGRDTSMASVGSLANASWLARKIITIWNMENPMALYGNRPPWRKRVKPIGPKIDFEGHLYHTYRAIAPPIKLDLIDDVATRTEELMQDMYKKTVDLLRRHNAALLKTVKVLVDKRELSGDEIDFIIDKYPPGTPASIVLEERDPGSLPLFEEKQEQNNRLEYTLLTS